MHPRSWVIKQALSIERTVYSPYFDSSVLNDRSVVSGGQADAKIKAKLRHDDARANGAGEMSTET
jgi:hypothetical protein